MIKREMYMKRIRPFIGTELISELLQLAKGWSNLVSNRIIIWRLHYSKTVMPSFPLLPLIFLRNTGFNTAAQKDGFSRNSLILPDPLIPFICPVTFMNTSGGSDGPKD